MQTRERELLRARNYRLYFQMQFARRELKLLAPLNFHCPVAATSLACFPSVEGSRPLEESVPVLESLSITTTWRCK